MFTEATVVWDNSMLNLPSTQVLAQRYNQKQTIFNKSLARKVTKCSNYWIGQNNVDQISAMKLSRNFCLLCDGYIGTCRICGRSSRRPHSLKVCHDRKPACLWKGRTAQGVSLSAWENSPEILTHLMISVPRSNTLLCPKLVKWLCNASHKGKAPSPERVKRPKLDTVHVKG